MQGPPTSSSSTDLVQFFGRASQVFRSVPLLSVLHFLTDFYRTDLNGTCMYVYHPYSEYVNKAFEHYITVICIEEDWHLVNMHTPSM